jgi:hypothetical protein
MSRFPDKKIRKCYIITALETQGDTNQQEDVLASLALPAILIWIMLGISISHRIQIPILTLPMVYTLCGIFVWRASPETKPAYTGT